ncbi:MAG: PD40 domain-containing protein [Desulfarculus sp.]|nr:PD40 domain-containing protein [Desulfarculus sp.]
MKNSKAKRLLLWLSITVFYACASDPHGYYDRESLQSEYAAFSPTGETIAIDISWKHINGLFLMDRQGRVLKYLCKTTKVYYSHSPAFSPNGEKIAFVSNRDEDNGDIFIMDKDGSNQRRLTSTSDHDRNPVFSSDGSNICFIRYPRGSGFPMYTGSAGSHRGDIWAVNMTTQQEMRITNFSLRRLYSFDLLPNDDYLLIGGTVLPGFRDVLWKIDIKHLNDITELVPDLTPFSPAPARRLSPNREPSIAVPFRNLSQDGRYLVFPWANHSAWNVDYQSQVYVTDMTNMKTTKIPSFGNSSAIPLAISADGQQILFKKRPRSEMPFGPTLSDSPLYIVNRDGSGLRNLTLDFTAIWPEVLEAKKKAEPGW